VTTSSDRIAIRRSAGRNARLSSVQHGIGAEDGEPFDQFRGVPEPKPQGSRQPVRSFALSVLGGSAGNGPSSPMVASDGCGGSCDTGIGKTCDGGCEGAEQPCANCAQGGAANAAVEWAQMIARDATTPFWAAAMVAQVVADAPSRIVGDPHWDNLETALAFAQHVENVSQQGLNADGSLSHLESELRSASVLTGSVSQSSPGTGGEPSVRAKQISPAPSGLAECCAKLEYPWTGPDKVKWGTQCDIPENEGRRDPSATPSCSMGARFETLATYYKTPDPPCHCPCCVFIQEVLYRKVRMVGSSGNVNRQPETPDIPPGGGMDCRWKVHNTVDGTDRYVSGNQFGPHAGQPLAKADVPIFPPECYGADPAVEPDITTARSHWPGHLDAYIGKDKCKYWAADLPGLTVGAFSEGELTLLFRARVWDRCRREDRRIRYLYIRFKAECGFACDFTYWFTMAW
jgi:hypothetical protein